MGHFISGIVGDLRTLNEFSVSNELHCPAKLIGNFGFLPLSDDHLDSLYPAQGDFDPAMTDVSTSLKESLAELSAEGPVAFIETEYFGGVGAQGATVFDHGRCVMPPVTEKSGPMSKALSLLGIAKLPGHFDEFESAGLNRHRTNDGWIEAAKTESEPACEASPLEEDY